MNKRNKMRPVYPIKSLADFEQCSAEWFSVETNDATHYLSRKRFYDMPLCLVMSYIYTCKLIGCVEEI